MMLKTQRAARRALALALVLAMMAASGALASAQYSTLAFGSKGSAVLKLQKTLLAMGFDPNGTDGKFGRGTESAVKLYQASKGITADGKAGSQTLTALYSDASASESTTTSDTGDTSAYATGTNPDTIQYGDSGDKVTALQTALVKLGYSTNGIDGRFGAGTRKAVIAFQKANGLTADGLAGTQTQNLINSQASAATSDTSGSGSSTTTADSSASSSGFTRTLRKGYSGSDVSSVQTQLKALGYYTSTVDGVYGTGTMAAVSAFQKKNSLSADGLVGSKTYAAIFSSSAVSNTSTSTTSDTTTTDSSSSSSTSSDSGSSTYTSLSYGASGDAVKALQKALKALGYNVVVDSDYGALTQSAITAFQKLNGLTADGVAGALTQEKLFSGSAVAYDSSVDTNTIISDDTGKADGPSVSEVKCLYWFTEVKPSIKSGQKITIFDPATNLEWTLRLYSLGHHADSEPLTAIDTAFKEPISTTNLRPRVLPV